MRKRAEPSERARVVVNVRVLPALRLELDAAAQQNGRTLSSEIEARLAESLGHRPAAPDLRTLIREELEADRKRQTTPANGMHSNPGVNSLSFLGQKYADGVSSLSQTCGPEAYHRINGKADDR